MKSKAKVLIAASTKARAKAISQELNFLERGIDVTVDYTQPENFSPYRLFICEVGPKLPSPAPFLEKLRKDAHVILIIPELDVRWVAFYMQDPRVNHFLSSKASLHDIHAIVEKLDTGAIFGLERYLPAQTTSAILYRRLTTFKERCDAIEEIDAFTKKNRMRSHIRRLATQNVEEMLMNAMYQAPVDISGKRIFAEVEPRVRIRKKTPKPISLRYTAHEGTFFVSIRDRFGSFRREDLAHYLLRCATSKIQLEDKKLGAGLGLYLVASTSTRLIINILPGNVTEFICIQEPNTDASQAMHVLSVTTQRPMKDNEGIHMGTGRSEEEMDIAIYESSTSP